MSFSVRELKKLSSHFKIYNLVIVGSFLFVFIHSWTSTEMSLTALIKGLGDVVSYIKGDPNIEGSGYFPPSFNTDNLKTYFWAMVETVQMAIVALVLSVIIAWPLSFMTARNMLKILIPGETLLHNALRNLIYVVGTLIANVFRSVNELVWALIFVTAVGLGPMAGIMALAVHTSGALSKVLSEGIEAIDPGPVQALVLSGAGFIKVIRYAVWPQVAPHFISMTLYRFESDVRSATILGFVGAGGIGYYLFEKIRTFENAEVSTILIIIIATVWILDNISAYLRKKFI